MRLSMISFVILTLIVDLSAQQTDKPKPRCDIFSFNKEVTLPRTPTQIFNAATGDISGWWDHSLKIPKSFLLRQNQVEDSWKYLMRKEMEFYTPQLFILSEAR